MLEDELLRHVYRLRGALGDPEAWVELARLVARSGLDAPRLPRRLLPELLRVWSQAPAERHLEHLFWPMAGLEAARVEPNPLGPWWFETRRLSTVGGSPHDRDTGLPLQARRREDGLAMLLVPEMLVQLSHPGCPGPHEYTLKSGYLSQPFLLETDGVRAGRVGQPRPPVPRLVLDQGQLEECARASGVLLPPRPTPRPQAIPASLLLGRGLAHGLAPRDCGPLPRPWEPGKPGRFRIDLRSRGARRHHQGMQGLLPRLRRLFLGDG